MILRYSNDDVQSISVKEKEKYAHPKEEKKLRQKIFFSNFCSNIFSYVQLRTFFLYFFLFITDSGTKSSFLFVFSVCNSNIVLLFC